MRIPKRKKGQSPAHARSPQQERELADKLGGRVTRGSGSGNEKGDVRVRGVMRLEAKTTTSASFALNKRYLTTLFQQAAPHGEIPVMVIEFVNKEGVPEQSWGVVPMWVLEELADAQA